METTARTAPSAVSVSDGELWRKLAAFDFDRGGKSGAFARRLAAENNWTAAFADQAIEEYRRFLYLMKTAGRMVTPSLAVDEVWHLHLIYTRSYWVHLCQEIFGEAMHHLPGDGTDEDEAKYAAIYVRTLADYEASFGPPPAAIWGSAEDTSEKLVPGFHWRNILIRCKRLFSLKLRS